MLLKKWCDLPSEFQTDAVEKYYDILKKRNISLIFKRISDIIFSLLFILVFSPIFLVLTIAVAVSSGFPVFYRQRRVTAYGKDFSMLKFRTMVKNADKIGTLVTVDHDPRITKIGAFLRKYRLDELPQIFNVLAGDMTLVGTRPEVRKYVDAYSDEMLATLLLPAGVTSPASVLFKDEAELLNGADNPDDVYIKKVLPEKMQYNLKYLRDFSYIADIKAIFATVIGVFK